MRLADTGACGVNRHPPPRTARPVVSIKARSLARGGAAGGEDFLRFACHFQSHRFASCPKRRAVDSFRRLAVTTLLRRDRLRHPRPFAMGGERPSSATMSSKPAWREPTGGMLFGDPPPPRLDFLQLRPDPPGTQDAKLYKIAKYRNADCVMMRDSITGLDRSVQIRKLEVANKNHRPYLIGDTPEAVYLVQCDSTETTYARSAPRWVPERMLNSKPHGSRREFVDSRGIKWSRVWSGGRIFDNIAAEQEASKARAAAAKAAELDGTLLKKEISRRPSSAAATFGRRPWGEAPPAEVVPQLRRRRSCPRQLRVRQAPRGKVSSTLLPSVAEQPHQRSLPSL